jgi:propionyl-CoA carboxylase alpha chain
VTEAVTGLDLVREQLFVAAGEAIEFDQDDVTWKGAAIEARLYAEDPAAGFLPATGTLIAYEPADQPPVRWDSGVAAGSEIGVHFDPMLAKVIAHAPTRGEAARRLALALERTHLGGVTTNRDFLVATLRSPDFLDGDTTTDFIDRVAPLRTIALDDDELDHVAAVAALWLQGMNRTRAGVLESVPSGWRNARLPDQAVSFACGEREVKVSYHRLRDGAFRLGGGGLARLHDWQPASVDVEVGNRRFRSRIARSGDRLVVETPRGDVELILQPRFPQPGATDVMGGLVAPMPGKVIDVRVKVGDSVQAGDVLVVLEAMKMEHPMTAPQDGVVNEVHVSVGDQVESGALLLHVEPLESEKD